MFVMIRRRASLAVLLLLIFGSVWATNERPERSDESVSGLCNGLRRSETETVEVSKGVIVTNIIEASESEVAGTLWEEVVNDTQAKARIVSSSPSPLVGGDNPLQLRRRSETLTEAEAAQITKPPLLLLPRQDQAQVDQLNSRIQSLQQSAQQALQALSDASRSVSQASQQLSQSSEQLSQSNSRLSGSSQQISLQLSIATQSVQSLTGALSAAVSSGSSAFSSCTSSASKVLALASVDAQTQVGQALAQVTVARSEADRELVNARNSAVSITQAAAIIVGASVGSSLLTIAVVICIIRHRRKKRLERQAAEDGMYGGNGAGTRPGTNDSYNSMVAAATATRDMKDTPPAPPSVQKAEPAPLSRFQSVRIIDVSRNASSASANPPPPRRTSFLADRLSKLGLTRRPTGGEALTTDYVQRPSSPRKPVVAKPAEPPNNEGSPSTGASLGNKATAWSVFPKVDPDPRGTALLRQQQKQQQAASASDQPTLQTWLEAASVSPFGPLGPPPPAATAQRSSRLSGVKWPLQDTTTANTTNAGGLLRSATDASSRYSQQEEDEVVPRVTVRENPDTRSPVIVGPGRMTLGLPGKVRKVGGK